MSGEKEESPPEDANRTYQFVATEKELRCFVFEVVTTYGQGAPNVAVLDDIYNWINTGEKPRGGLKAVK